MTHPKLDLVLFDLIGTTVKDSNKGGSLILDSFSKAFASNGLKISHERLNQERGKIKKEAIQNILNERNAGMELTKIIYESFIDLLSHSIDSFTEMEGATKLFDLLKEKGVTVAVGSGLPLNFMNRLFEHLDWRLADFDYINSSEELGEGRPNPLMILDAMDKFGLTNKSRILKIGDTVVDIQEGKNAGVLTAGVLTGTQKRTEFEKYQPDFIFRGIHELESIL